MPVMWIIGGVLIFLAIKKEMEPPLLLPMGFGAILVNLPFSGAAVIDHLFSRKKINPMIFIFIVTGVIILVLILNTTVEVVANKRKK